VWHATLTRELWREHLLGILFELRDVAILVTSGDQHNFTSADGVVGSTAMCDVQRLGNLSIHGARVMFQGRKDSK
jgi:hypothetical protein